MAETALKKVPLTATGKKSSKLAGQTDARTQSQMQIPSLAFYNYLMYQPMLPPSKMPDPAFTLFYSDIEVVAPRVSKNPDNAPKLNFKEWADAGKYYDFGYYFNGLSYYGLFTDYNGDKFYVQRQELVGWGDELFWFWDAEAQNYVEFVPNGYYAPSKVWKATGESMNAFADVFESAVDAFALAFVGGGSRVVAQKLWKCITKMLLNMAVEVVRQVITENKTLQTVDIADVVLEGVPAPKAIKGKLKEVLFSTLIALFEAGIDYNEETGWETYDKKKQNIKNKEKATVLSQLVIKTIKVSFADFVIWDSRLNFDKGSLEAELIDKYLTFITSRGWYETFEK